MANSSLVTSWVEPVFYPGKSSGTSSSLLWRRSVLNTTIVTVTMSLRVRNYILIVVFLFGLVLLLQKLPIGENWKYHIVSALVQRQLSNLSRSHQVFQHKGAFHCPHLGQPQSPKEELEERNLLDLIAWPKPPSGSEALDLSQTSDPLHSHFTIVPAKNWSVGDQLEVQVQLRDFKGRPKRYGGDLLLARLHSPKDRAGVAGQVLDHKNGLYSARFPLLWQGSAQVVIMMVHSSEAVAVLQRLRETLPHRVFFVSLFRRGLSSETTSCDTCLPSDQGPLCNYTDLHSGEPWYCFKPKNLSCDTRINHARAGYLQNIITERESLLFQSGVNIKVPIRATTTNTITVMPSIKESSSQKTDPVKLGASGYYYQDSWRPFNGLTMRRFDRASITRCLTNKLIYMYGDSTIRQWYEYIVGVIPEMKQFDLHTPKKAGPLMAVDRTHNIVLKYRCHGPPIIYTAIMANELRYIANELDGMIGGPNTVVALSVWAHFGPFPVEVYLRRLRHIRKAVVRLLNRAPETVIVIRTANPRALDRDVSLNHSDWFALQLDVMLRAMFKGLNVMLVDAWQMCVAHHQPHDVHPPGVIVKNMVDMMLSYVCRDRSQKITF
ncbi:NXPE family member 3-like [Syngnathus typhle]|uniref:NXPE family member 3-like n=1 Tax=Syngnathus typhle TaxID=161592 RepID=UPI002A6A7B36|nr:NXPE family member 3-like [Syngnathus typhle]